MTRMLVASALAALSVVPSVALAQSTASGNTTPSSAGTATTSARATVTPTGAVARQPSGGVTTSSNGQAPAATATAETPPREQGGRTHIFFVNGGIGASYVDLVMISHSNFASVMNVPTVSRTNGFGPSFNVSAGFHLAFFDLGARLTFSPLSSFDIGTLAILAGLRLPTPIVQFYGHLGFGYAWVGSFGAGPSGASVYGYVFQAALGLQILLGDLFRLGFQLDVDIMNLSRQRLDTNPPGFDVDLTRDGNAVGGQGRALLTIGLHI